MMVKPYKAEHALALVVRDIEKGMKNDEGFARWAEEVNAPGTSYSMFVEDSLLGCAGVNILWQGVGEGWVILSPEVVHHKIKVCRAIRKYLEKIVRENNLHRVQAHVSCDFEAAINFVESLGFELEGRMKKFYPEGTDCFLYALLR